MLFVADLNSSEDFAESRQQLLFEGIVEFRPALGKGVEKGIEHWLSKSIEVFLKKNVVLLFVNNRQKQSNIIFSNPFLQLSLRVLVLPLMKKFTNRKPKAVRHQGPVLLKI